MLPTLAADVTGRLPALDRERLAALDEQIGDLVDSAREQGVPESTVLSIFAARERLYADRAAAWTRLTLYGKPLASLERLGDDETAARAWVTDRLGEAVADQVARTVQTGRDGSLPHFEDWFLDRDGSDETPDDLLVTAHQQYADWLDEQARVVVSEAADRLAGDGAINPVGSVSAAARTAVAEFQAAAFGELDEQLTACLRRSVGAVPADADADDQPVTGRRGRLRRLLGRLLGGSGPVVEEQKPVEYGAVSEFFRLANAMSAVVDSIAASGAITGFKLATGLDVVEGIVFDTARVRLDGLVNRDTAFAFLAKFDGDLRRRPPRRTPVTFATAGGESTVTFTRAALDDDRWARMLHEDVTRMLRREISHHPPSPELVATLCRECHEALAATDGRGAALGKRVLRRLALAFHPDARVDGGRPDAGETADARTVSRLLELQRAGRLEIRAADAAITIVTRARS